MKHLPAGTRRTPVVVCSCFANAPPRCILEGPKDSQFHVKPTWCTTPNQSESWLFHVKRPAETPSKPDPERRNPRAPYHSIIDSHLWRRLSVRRDKGACRKLFLLAWILERYPRTADRELSAVAVPNPGATPRRSCLGCANARMESVGTSFHVKHHRPHLPGPPPARKESSSADRTLHAAGSSPGGLPAALLRPVRHSQPSNAATAPQRLGAVLLEVSIRQYFRSASLLP